MARSRTAKRPLESSVEAALVRYARERGILTRKFASPARRGVPDRIFLYKGCVLFLEVKRPGEKPTALQEHELRELRNHGGHAEWCDTVFTGKALLDHYFFPEDLL